MLDQLRSMAERGTVGFADSLAMQAAELCRKLALEHAVQYAQSFAEVSKQRDDLRTENAKLKSDLKAYRDGLYAPRLEIHLDGETEPARPSPSGRVRELQLDNKIDESIPLASATVSQSPSDIIDRAYAQDPTQLQGTADQHMLRKAFKEADRRRVKRLCAEDVVAHMEAMGDRSVLSLEELRTSFCAINAASNFGKAFEASVFRNDSVSLKAMNSWSLGSESSSSCYPDELGFDGFRMLILGEVDDIVGAEAALTVHEVRQFYIRFTAEQAIVERTRVRKDVLNTAIKEGNVPFWVEPTIGVVILVNACTIGISQDFAQESRAWSVVEFSCTAVFVFEIIIKLLYEGFCGHFFGHGWAWNWFDFLIVVIALTDVVFVLSDSLDMQDLPRSMGGITIVRLVRLLRIARLVRLLRMKFFKELSLMVHGVMSGLKTLCWAFVFLVVLVYILGVLVKQLLDPKTFATSCGTDDDTSADDVCSLSEKFLLKNNALLFSTVFRSMFTVFRCLVGDCNAPDGMPLAPHLMDSLGVLFTTGYLLVTCFVLFGVFNLVMAIFVENTLETARISQQKRHQARRTEDIRVAQELRKIVLRICTKRTQTERPRRPSNRFTAAAATATKGLTTQKSGLMRSVWRRLLGQPVEYKSDSLIMDEDGDTMHMVVTRDVFEEVMEDPSVMHILEDLEISVTDHAKLFDIIDSNGSGQLDIVEIIEGLMKLRGPADKGDLVCAALMVRSVQRELKRLESEMILRHKTLQEGQSRTLNFLQLFHQAPVQTPSRLGTHTAL